MSGRTRVAGTALLLAALCGCSGRSEPEIMPGVDACRRCNMVIDHVRQACGFVAQGKFVTFDSPACLLSDYEALRKQGGELPTEIFFADYRDGSFIPAEAVSFLLTRHVPTVMDGGVICFADDEAAQVMRQQDDVVTDWVGFRRLRGEPDRELAVLFEPCGMSPQVVAANKGELVLLRARAVGFEEDLTVALKGYPELGRITLPSSGEEVSFQILALRPGAGFPFVHADGDDALGRLSVAGAHTADEEAM